MTESTPSKPLVGSIVRKQASSDHGVLAFSGRARDYLNGMPRNKRATNTVKIIPHIGS